MPAIIRPATAEDAAAIVALNTDSEAVLSPMGRDRFEALRQRCALLQVAEQAGVVAGFLMAFCDGSDYDSENYRWFSTHYSDFLYIDRVVVSRQYRGRGIASSFYEDALKWAARRGLHCLVAEIDIKPPNTASLKFHAAFGFAEVGRLAHSPRKVVSLQHRPVR